MFSSGSKRDQGDLADMASGLQIADGVSRRRSRAASRDCAAIEVIESLEAARDAWAELSPHAAVSPYQSHRFLSNWFETVGRRAGLEPFIIVARDPAGRPRALLPLCVGVRSGLRIAAFLGGRDSNFNLGLLHRNAAFDERSLRDILLAAARKLPKPPDLVYLRHQPRRFDGVANPLAFSTAIPSASFAYGRSLPASVDALTASLAKDARKKLRRKEARLAEFGEVVYEHAATGERARAILSALVQQKSARFAQVGLDNILDAGVIELLERASAESGEGALEAHGLSVGGRIVATYVGLVRNGRFSAMMNSFDMDEEIARNSPGELLLHALMRNLVDRGFTAFDLGVGEARYKNAVCDETIELCDVVMATRWRGVPAALLLSVFLRSKRLVKQSRRAKVFAEAWRQLLHAKA